MRSAGKARLRSSGCSRKESPPLRAGHIRPEFVPIFAASSESIGVCRLSIPGVGTSCGGLDRIAADDDFHAPVPLTAGCGFVSCHGPRLAEAPRRYNVRLDSLRHQELAHAVGALFRELLIV